MDIARYTAMAHLVRSIDGDWVNARLDKEQKAIAVTTMRSGKTTLTFRINGKEFTVTIQKFGSPKIQRENHFEDKGVFRENQVGFNE